MPVNIASIPTRDTKVPSKPAAPGTYLARVMGQRRLRKLEICTAMRVSERQLYNYMSLRKKVPALEQGRLCDFLDLEQSTLFNRDGFLRRG